MHFLFNAKQTQSAENTLCPYSEGKLDEYEISILVTLQISQRKTTMANQYKLILKKKKQSRKAEWWRDFLLKGLTQHLLHILTLVMHEVFSVHAFN